jgi:hypothetical protein
MNSKKALTGSIILLFICTIFIIFILVVFAIGSSLVRKFQDIKSYEKIERIGPSQISGAAGFYEREYERINRNIQHNSRMNFMLNCEGEFNGKTMEFYEILGLWNETNTQEIADFSKNSGCGTLASAAFWNKNYGKYFYCDIPHIDCVIQDPPKDIERFDFINNLENCGIRIELSPYNMVVFISNYCDINLGELKSA